VEVSFDVVIDQSCDSNGANRDIPLFPSGNETYNASDISSLLIFVSALYCSLRRLIYVDRDSTEMCIYSAVAYRIAMSINVRFSSILSKFSRLPHRNLNLPFLIVTKPDSTRVTQNRLVYHALQSPLFRGIRKQLQIPPPPHELSPDK